MSTLGQKQTLFVAIPMSALPPKADMFFIGGPTDRGTGVSYRLFGCAGGSHERPGVSAAAL